MADAAMSVYVDELRVWPGEKPVCFRNGSCHLTADSLEELHAMAHQLGLPRAWFQDHRLAPHYDLTPRTRVRAIGLGARFVPARLQAKTRVYRRSAILEGMGGVRRRTEPAVVTAPGLVSDYAAIALALSDAEPVR